MLPVMLVSEQDFYIVPDRFETADVFFTSRLDPGQAQDVRFDQADKVALLIFDGVEGQRVRLESVIERVFQLGRIRTPVDLSITDPNGSSLVRPSQIKNGFVEPVVLPVTGTYTIALDKIPYPTSSGNINIKVINVPPDSAGTIEIDGQAVRAANTAPGQNARLTFDGTAGQNLSLFGETTRTRAHISILNPDGSTLVSPASIAFRNAAFVEDITLPTDGTYTVFIDPAAESIATIEVKLSSSPTDISKTINADGSDTTITTVPGQNAEVTFNGTADQKISLKLQASGIGRLSTRITIEQPNGSILVNNQAFLSYFLDATILPQTGVYKIKLDPAKELAGTITLNLYDVPDITESITIDGPDVTVSTTVPGQNAEVTFNGTADQKISLKLQASGIGRLSTRITIEQPNGTKLITKLINNRSLLSYFIDSTTLPQTGVYKIKLDPSEANVGKMTLTLYDVPDDTTESITIDGPDVTVSTTAPGQNAKVTFTGTAGQTLHLNISNVSIRKSTISVLRPDGTTFLRNGSIFSERTRLLSLYNLPVSGTYTIVIDPDAESTGQMTLSLAPPVDVTGSISIGDG